ncbi:MAG: hypothetical protein ACRESZ_07900 [Methylococcales bacterium]
MQQQALGLAEHYEIIKDELERTDEYMESEYEIGMQKLSERVSHWGLVLALISIYYSVVPTLSGFHEDLADNPIWAFIKPWVEVSHFLQQIIVVLTYLIGPFVLVGVMIQLVIKKRRAE